jgi:hypothetical protein
MIVQKVFYQPVGKGGGNADFVDPPFCGVLMESGQKQLCHARILKP